MAMSNDQSAYQSLAGPSGLCNVACSVVELDVDISKQSEQQEIVLSAVQSESAVRNDLTDILHSNDMKDVDANKLVVNYAKNDPSSASPCLSEQTDSYLCKSIVDLDDLQPIESNTHQPDVQPNQSILLTDHSMIDLTLSSYQQSLHSVGLSESFVLSSMSPPHHESSESLNIRTDEQMPAKGEISEQESNGDVDGSYNQQQIYSQNRTVHFPSGSFDTTVARESWSLSSEPINMHCEPEHRTSLNSGPCSAAIPMQALQSSSSSDNPCSSSSLGVGCTTSSSASPPTFALRTDGSSSASLLSSAQPTSVCTETNFPKFKAEPSTSTSAYAISYNGLSTQFNLSSDNPNSLLSGSSDAVDVAGSSAYAVNFMSAIAGCSPTLTLSTAGPSSNNGKTSTSPTSAAAFAKPIAPPPANNSQPSLRYRCTVCPLAFSSFKLKCQHMFEVHQILPLSRAARTDQNDATVGNASTSIVSPAATTSSASAASFSNSSSSAQNASITGKRIVLLRYRCLICPHAFSSFKQKCQHMFSAHNVKLLPRMRDGGSQSGNDTLTEVNHCQTNQRQENLQNHCNNATKLVHSLPENELKMDVEISCPTGGDNPTADSSSLQPLDVYASHPDHNYANNNSCQGTIESHKRVKKLRYRCTECAMAFSSFKAKCSHLLITHNVTLKPRQYRIVRERLVKSECEQYVSAVYLPDATDPTAQFLLTPKLEHHGGQYPATINHAYVRTDVESDIGADPADGVSSVYSASTCESVQSSCSAQATCKTRRKPKSQVKPNAKRNPSSQNGRMHQMTIYLLNQNWDALRQRIQRENVIRAAADTEIVNDMDSSSSNDTKANLPLNLTDMPKMVCPIIDPKSPLVCAVCQQHFQSIKAYDQHMQTHPVECFTCSRKFHRWVNMSVHLKRHLNIREYACTDCPKRFVGRQALIEHRTTHTGEAPLACNSCPRRFRRISNLIQHKKRFHLNIRPRVKDYICQCGEVFQSEAKLAWHQETHDTQPKCCPFCRLRYVHRNSLVCHIRLSHSELYVKALEQDGLFEALTRTLGAGAYRRPPVEMVKCPVCQLTIRKSSMKGHLRTHAVAEVVKTAAAAAALVAASLVPAAAADEPAEAPVADGGSDADDGAAPRSLSGAAASVVAAAATSMTLSCEVYTCLICNKKLSTKWNLKQHKWTHANNSSKPFRCTVCPKGFVRETDLDTHMNLHRAIRRHTCDYCGLQFNNKYNWLRHTREHEQSKSFQCDECEKSFHRRYYLTEHKRSHTGERPFECVICGKTSTTKANHNKHVRIHHARDPLTAEV